MNHNSGWMKGVIKVLISTGYTPGVLLKIMMNKIKII